MLIPVVQHWRQGRAFYRPAGETINPLEYDVAEIKQDGPARDFCAQHHYLGASYPAARYRFGLFRGGVLEGVAVYSVPVNDLALDGLPGHGQERTELGRLVLLDRSGTSNAETWFVARTFELLAREGLASALAFSDPVPRLTSDGQLSHRGHYGCVYQSGGASYQGRGTPRTLRLLPDGSTFSARAMQKIRKREQGWRYAAAQLEALGAAPMQADADSAAWLKHNLRQYTRPLRHPGNYKYHFGLTRAARRHLLPSLPYPKPFHDAPTLFSIGADSPASRCA